MLALLATAAVLAPTRIHVAPRIDGVLDDPVWATVPESGRFTQSFPHDGAQPSEPTSVRVAYDRDYLYVAIDCVQSARRVARLTRRDRDVDDDRVAIDLDTSHDRRSAFHFQISAAGVLVDGLRFNDTDYTTDWDDVWRGEVATTERGWSAELAIPLRILRLHDRVDTWGFQVRRYIGAHEEEDRWAYASRDAGGEVSRYGELGPFDGLSPRGSLAIVPFALARLVSEDPALPTPYGNGVSGAVGLDLTWRPAPPITLQAAVLPDFGQVEADQIVINLTTTEIEYPEKRPFFLQGMDLFQTPIQLLYTRRIGRVPFAPILPDGANQIGAAGPAPVLAAGKLIATAGPVDIGALSVLTGGVDAITDSAGTVLAAPTAQHHVVRARASGDGVTIGALGTAQLQSDVLTRHPVVDGMLLCPTGELVPIGARCSHDAIAGGVDAAWRSRDGAYVLSGQLAASKTRGGPTRTLLDGTQLASGDAGVGGVMRAAKEGGWLRAELVYEGYARKFDIDDLGYLARANVHHIDATIGAFSAHPGGPFVEAHTNVEFFYRRNMDGLVLPNGYQWNFGATTRGLWQLWSEIHWRPHYFDDRELGDGRALERTGRLGWELSINSDPRRSLVGAWSSALRSTHAGWEFDLDGDLKVRVRDNVELDIQPAIVISNGEPRYVFASDPDGSPRFARLYASSIGVTTRATWTLTRDLTLQAYVQALLASLAYRDPFVADPSLRVIGIDQLQPASFDPSTHDTREGALNAVVVARWEYRLGSLAYLVYTHSQIPVTGMGFDPHALSRGPGSDALLVKLSWAWLR
jgi:hypothetical protein